MKRFLLLGISLLAVAACAPQAAPPPPEPIAARPYAAGSAANTTTAFDGNWGPVTVTRTSVGCSDVTYHRSHLTIQNGLAQIHDPSLGGIRLQGYVTPQGTLTMQSNTGQSFEGQFNASNALVGQARGPDCVWDVTWSNRVY
jgi:hypothetical protein